MASHGPPAQLVPVLRYLDPFAASADSLVGTLPFLDEAAARVSLPRRWLSLGIVGLFLSFVLFGLGQSLLCTAVGILYPAYMSMKALEARPLNQDTMIQWLTYWVAYSLFSVVEVFASYLLFCASAGSAAAQRRFWLFPRAHAPYRRRFFFRPISQGSLCTIC